MHGEIVKLKKKTKNNLCITLINYQESLHDARSTQCKITYTVKHDNVFFALLATSFGHYGHHEANIVQKF